MFQTDPEQLLFLLLILRPLLTEPALHLAAGHGRAIVRDATAHVQHRRSSCRDFQKAASWVREPNTRHVRDIRYQRRPARSDPTDNASQLQIRLRALGLFSFRRQNHSNSEYGE